MKSPATSKNYMTVADVKDFLNISQSEAYNLVHRKDFPICRFGSCIRVPRDAFLAWVEQHTRIPSSLAA